MEKTKRSTFIEDAKNLIEAVAIIIGGCWALMVFGLKEIPAYNKSFKITADFKIDSINISDKKKCEANLSIDIKNVRPTSLTIDSMRLQLWYFPVDSISDNGYLNYLTYTDNPKHKPFYDYTHYANGLIAYYPIDGDAHEDIGFLIDKDETKGIICKYTPYGHTKDYIFQKAYKIESFGFSWLFKCSPEKSTFINKN